MSSSRHSYGPSYGRRHGGSSGAGSGSGPAPGFRVGATGSETSDMVTTLVRLREALGAADLSLAVPGAEMHQRTRAQLIDQLEDYVLPRLIQLEAPLLTVVGGSTGAGKSTLVNSLVGRVVTEPGVLRPTTRSPVLVHNPADAEWFAKDRILPDLARTAGTAGGPGALQLVPSESVPAGLAILDAPDVDSVDEQNRTLAGQLLAAADLWLFVTSAARYADQVPWEYLRAAAERSTAVAVVLDRTPREAITEVSTHLARMMTARGLRDSPLFTVPEVPLGEDGLVAEDLVAEIRSWLHLLASDSNARAAVVKQTLDGAVRTLARSAHTIADAAAEQTAAAGRLRDDAARAYREARDEVGRALADGSLLRGEALARWQELIGTGELFASVESQLGHFRSHLRGRLTAALRGALRGSAPASVRGSASSTLRGSSRGRLRQAEGAAEALAAALTALLVDQAETAAGRVGAAWGEDPAGQRLLTDRGADLTRASRGTGAGGFQAAAEAAVRDWRRAVLELVRRERPGVRSAARYLASAANALGVALMVVVLTAAGDDGKAGADGDGGDERAGADGDSGAAGDVGADGDLGAAGAGALVGQRVLEAVFGDAAVRRMTAGARADLDRRVGALFDAERKRFETVLEDLAPGADVAERLRETARRVDDLRFAGELGGADFGSAGALQDIDVDQDAEAGR